MEWPTHPPLEGGGGVSGWALVATSSGDGEGVKTGLQILVLKASSTISSGSLVSNVIFV